MDKTNMLITSANFTSIRAFAGVRHVVRRVLYESKSCAQTWTCIGSVSTQHQSDLVASSS